MDYLKIQSDRTHVDVSKIIIGTDKLTDLYCDKEIFHLLDVFIAAGGNCVDTARVYCGGSCEEAVGRWLEQNGSRSKVVISTKGCHPPPEDMPHSRLSKKEMESDLDASLKALKTDYIDIYWLHRDDINIPAEQIIEDINTFAKSGKIRLIGCSNWNVDRIEKANVYAKKNGLQGFSASQILWSLAYTTENIYDDYGIAIMNNSSYSWYLNNQMPIFAYGSQAQGFFSKMSKSGADSLSALTRKRYGSMNNLIRLKKVQELALSYGVSLSAAVLSYITCNRLPAAAIIGCKTTDQLEESLQAGDMNIEFDTADELFKIDR
jgi:aryl-alcohol dehydrogenase-like predicted oxidoreductase